jgi:hypothetical protein
MTALVAAFALLPLSAYGLFIAQDDGLINSVQARPSANQIQFTLVAAADAIAACFPNATATVKVSQTADETGTDTFTLVAKGLRPNTTYAVFLTELATPPFGAVQFLARLDTNAKGKGSVVLWFANPADADGCFAPAVAPVTPFDADGTAGPAALSSKNALPGTPLP